MDRKTSILEQAGVGVQRKRLQDLLALTDDEVLRLMRAATHGRTTLEEADTLTICQWAQAQKVGAVVLELALCGHLRLAVVDGAITFALLDGARDPVPRCPPQGAP